MAFARYREKRAFRRLGPPPKGVRLAAARIEEVFFGDIDDKYLPALHALRLVLRAGPIFLGAYIFAGQRFDSTQLGPSAPGSV
ncbi:MAG TPA: hypothetical protein VI094_11650 [Propionibacteriaceae bacterium]